MRIGVIADTHGLMRPQALAALACSDHILHAGDIGKPAVLDALRAIAPLTAIRGNNDTAPWAQSLQETETLDLAGVRIHVVHDLAQLDIDPRADGVAVVVHGHSHRPTTVERDGVLYLNPGSAGPRRFTLPLSVAWLVVEGGRCRAEIVPIATA